MRYLKTKRCSRGARAVVALAVAAALLPAAGAAQVGDPLPQSLGLGGNYLALARGIGAPAWNPAGLGLPDNPGVSFALLPVSVNGGLDPVSVTDFTAYGGELIPHDTRQRWLDRIRTNGGEAGAFSGDVTFAAVSVGPVAVSASSNVRGQVNMAPDVAELFLFGNAGLTGEPGQYDLEGSEYDIAATSTVAASAALPLPLRLGPLPDQHFALGVTVKYTVGNFLMMGREQDSRLEADPLTVDIVFPMVHTLLPDSGGSWDVGDGLNNGSGWGLDVGAAWQGGMFSAGVTVRNIVNTFAWDSESLHYREGRATWSADTSFTSFEERDIAEAPAELLDHLGDRYGFSPVVAAGAAARLTPVLTVTGEVRHAVEEDLHVGVRNHVGVGAELTVVPFLPLRAGISKISGGFMLSGGLGLRMGPVQLSGSAALRDAGYGTNAVGAFGFTMGVR